MEESEGVVFVGRIIEDVCPGFVHGCINRVYHVVILWCGDLVEIMS